MLYEKLLNYQKSAVNISCSQPSTALLFDQGTGKTWVTAGIVEKLLHPKAEYLLIVNLTNIDTTWFKTLSQFKELAIFKDFNDYKAYKDGPKVFLIHYEGLPKVINKLCKIYWTLIVLDESQRIKGRNTQQSKRVAKLKLADHKVILSGTPLDKSPIDMWAQFRFVAPQVFGTRWKDFEDEYCYKTGFMGKEVKLRVKKLPQFLEKLKPYCLREVKSEVLNLPKLEIVLSPVELLGNQLRIYDEMNSEMITSLDGKTVEVELKITQIAKLQQICGGFIIAKNGSFPEGVGKFLEVLNSDQLSSEQKIAVKKAISTLFVDSENIEISLDFLMKNISRKYDSKYGSWQHTIDAFQGELSDAMGEHYPPVLSQSHKNQETLHIGRAKVRRVNSLIKTITKPVVIFCKYLEEIKMVSDELSYLKVAVLNGQTKNRSKIIEDFQSGVYDVIICQIKTGGVGIDLYKSCNVIFYSLTYSFIDYEQALSRVHRYGQTQPVKIYLIYAKNTIDEDIYKAILSKKSISDTVLKSLKGVTHGKN